MNKKILNLAIPNVISNVTVPLLGLIDLAMMGHLGSEKYIGAIALGTMIFNFIYMIFGFLRMGTSGFTSQAIGRRDFSESVSWLGRALIASTIAGLGLIILQIPIEWIAFKFVEGSAETELLAAEYFRIRIWAAPATIGMYGITGWFIGMQNTKTPMVLAILINLLNLTGNLIFVFGFDMKSSGVALGTVVAQYTGFFVSILLLRKYYGKLFKYFNKQAILKLTELVKFARVNANIFIRTICLISVMTYFTSVSAKLGDDILAANTLLFQFFMFFSYLMDGFAYASEALTGKYFGANDPKNLKKSIKYSFLWSFSFAIVFTLIYLVFAKNILSLLTNNQTIIEVGMEYVWWVVAIPIVSFSAFIWDGVYIGLTASKEMRNTMLLATAIFFPIWFLFRETYQNNALWLAMIVFLAFRGIFQTFYARKII